MQMTEAFASAVTVSVPIFALAAGAEARAIRERLRRPDLVAPTLYFLVPLMLPLDVMPQGLKETVLPGLSDKRGRGFVKLAFAELDGAMTRAADKLENAAQQPPGPAAQTTAAETGEDK